MKQFQNDHYSSSEDELHYFQLQSDHYASSEDEVHYFHHYSSSEDEVHYSQFPNDHYSSSEDEVHYFQLQSDHYASSEDEVHYFHHYSSSEDELHYFQLQSDHYESSFDYESLAHTNTSTTERGCTDDEGSCHIKQMDGIIDVPSLDYQSLASTKTFDVVDFAFFSIENKENDAKEVEEEKVINCCVRQGKWVTHYNSYHWMLLVGEGDFSFSASLAVAFGNAPNMIATSLNSIEYLRKTYSYAMSNIEKLRRRGCTVLHGIDATKIATPDLFGGMKFDRIIFNFPHAGFFKELPRDAQRRKHQELVSLFLKNARELICGDGEIHISHKTNGFHREWMLESLASSHKLGLIEAVDFNKYDYKGYHTKYGFGTDKNFNCHPSKTYKFGLKRSPSSAYRASFLPNIL